MMRKKTVMISRESREPHRESGHILVRAALILLLAGAAVLLVHTAWSVFPRGGERAGEEDGPETGDTRGHGAEPDGPGREPERIPDDEREVIVIPGKGGEIAIEPGKGGDVVVEPAKGDWNEEHLDLECSVPDRVTSSPLTVSGQVGKAGCAVTVNDVDATVRGRRFVARLDLAPGRNEILVVVDDPRGDTEVLTLFTTLAMSPEATFRSIVTTVAAGDWHALYAFVPPAARAENEADWERDKKERPARARRVAKKYGLPERLVFSSTYRDMFVLLIEQLFQREGARGEAFRSARVKKVESRGKGDKCVVRFQLEGEEKRMELEQVNGVWYLEGAPDFE